MSKKKYHLQSKESGSIILLGLLCDEKDYRMSWLLNEKLNIRLSRSENIRWAHKKLPKVQEFCCYRDSTSQAESIILIKNQSTEGLQIADYKQFDYLLISSKGDEAWKNSIKDIKEVRGVFDLDASGLDSIETS